MKNKILHFIVIAICCFKPYTPVFAQDSIVESRPVFATYSLGIGKSFALDTYLSPIRYSGVSTSFSGTWKKAFTQNPQHWSMHFDALVEFAYMLNPAKTAAMPELDFEFDWGAEYRWKLPFSVTVSAGAAIHTQAGMLYAMRNSNNPVSAKASIAIAATAAAYYDFKLGKLPLRISDRASLPSVGAFFSPAFGETYYEIYLGNHAGLVHPAWWGNHFTLRNVFSIDMDFGRTSMRLGYDLNVRTSYINHINTHIFTHSFIIGVTPGGLGLKNPKMHRMTTSGVNVVTPFN